VTYGVQIKKANISVEENQTFNRVGKSVNILILLLLMTWTWNLWTPFVFQVCVMILSCSLEYSSEYEISFRKQMASRSLKVMSRALEDRLPPPENKPEYTKWSPFPEEAELDEGERPEKEDEDEFIWRRNWDGF
jgi:hypothetical protein